MMQYQPRSGNSYEVDKLIRSLNDGLSNLKKAQTKKSFTQVYGTFYLLFDGRVVPLRVWCQMGSPRYVVAGTRGGCLGHFNRTFLNPVIPKDFK